MKKIIIFGLFILGAVTLSFGQSPLGKGGKQLNAGLGFSNYGIPLYVGVDFGVHPDITIGPILSFRSYSQNYYNGNGNVKYRQNAFGLGFNGNYHFDRLFDLPSEWNVYAGLTAGYYFWSDNDAYPGSEDSSFGLDAQVGARYFFNERFGLNLELGGGSFSSGGKFGITYVLQ